VSVLGDRVFFRWLHVIIASIPRRSSHVINQSINQSKSLINSCQTATEYIHMNCTNKNNDKMQ